MQGSVDSTDCTMIKAIKLLAGSTTTTKTNTTTPVPIPAYDEPAALLLPPSQTTIHTHTTRATTLPTPPPTPKPITPTANSLPAVAPAQEDPLACLRPKIAFGALAAAVPKLAPGAPAPYSNLKIRAMPQARQNPAGNADCFVIQPLRIIPSRPPKIEVKTMSSSSSSSTEGHTASIKTIQNVKEVPKGVPQKHQAHATVAAAYTTMAPPPVPLNKINPMNVGHQPTVNTQLALMEALGLQHWGVHSDKEQLSFCPGAEPINEPVNKSPPLVQWGGRLWKCKKALDAMLTGERKYWEENCDPHEPQDEIITQSLIMADCMIHLNSANYNENVVKIFLYKLNKQSDFDFEQAERADKRAIKSEALYKHTRACLGDVNMLACLSWLEVVAPQCLERKPCSYDPAFAFDATPAGRLGCLTATLEQQGQTLRAAHHRQQEQPAYGYRAYLRNLASKMLGTMLQLAGLVDEIGVA